MTDGSVNLRQVVYALSDALDLVGVDDVAHGKRVGIMAAECGKILHLGKDECNFLFELGLLHDIGVSSTRVHKNLVDEFDWEDSQEHADTGCILLGTFAPLAPMAQPVWYHHTRWDRLKAIGVDPRTARRANLTFLCDRVDVLAAPFYANDRILEEKDAIREAVARRAGEYFDPELVAVFHEISRPDHFWRFREPQVIQDYLHRQLELNRPRLVGIEELKQLSLIFSRIVDAKSPFTASHSLGVARLSRFFAERLGVNAPACDKIEIAGLLHDLGKLRIPDELLEKPSRLDAGERRIMNTHALETYLILRNISGFGDITRWAAYHHEEPDGSGYPFHVQASDMPFEARILRVADIFQAMSQDRPYRKGWDADSIADFMAELSQQGRVDEEVAALACACCHEAMPVARA
ncbi:MAG: HD-GYP domain-containing protein [Desulfobulbus sp.]